MRETRNAQLSIFDNYSSHPLGQQLRAVSDLLDSNPSLLQLVARDFPRDKVAQTGANGLSIESIFRCLLLKQMLQVSYEKLAFHLSDSITYRTFARLTLEQIPSRAGLHGAIRQIKSQTLKQISTLHVSNLISSGTINVDKLRIDSTVTASNIAPPSDSQLLADSIRVLSRLMAQSREITGVKIRFSDQRKKSKSLEYQIFNEKFQKKEALYPKLLRCAFVALKQSQRAIDLVSLEGISQSANEYWLNKMTHYLELFKAVIDQTQRRIYNDEEVPSTEKIVSIFEPHTDIIVKGEREVLYGHKVNLATQQDGFITYLNIESGNPSDATLYQCVLEACESDYRQTPKTAVADGCYASADNVTASKALGIRQNVFTKTRDLTLTQMGVKRKTFDALKCFRAGVEGNISELKRAFGAGKSTWKGLEGFNAFVWASTLCYNLIRTVRFSSA